MLKQTNQYPGAKEITKKFLNEVAESGEKPDGTKTVLRHRFTLNVQLIKSCTYLVFADI